jgi:hypothetical protein
LTDADSLFSNKANNLQATVIGGQQLTTTIHLNGRKAFLEDPILNRPSQVPECRDLEVLKVGLILCGDGVSSYKGKHAKSHSMFCVAHAVMNFPPWLRHKFLATSLTMTVHGPHEPHDGQPSLDIPTDEHLRLYEEGVPMWDHCR